MLFQRASTRCTPRGGRDEAPHVLAFSASLAADRWRTIALSEISGDITAMPEMGGGIA